VTLVTTNLLISLARPKRSEVVTFVQQPAKKGPPRHQRGPCLVRHCRPSADPFLRFLVDTFCQNGKRPSLREAIFLATWTVQHVIDTNPGGVAGPIRIATLSADSNGSFQAIELPESEIAEHQLAIESAAAALRKWRDGIQSGHAADDSSSPAAAAQHPVPVTLHGTVHFYETPKISGDPAPEPPTPPDQPGPPKQDPPKQL
jgi:hypothetical protein